MPSIVRRHAIVPLFELLALAGCSSAAPSGSPGSDAITGNHPRLTPAGIPGSYAATPYGFFDPSCMVQVQPGDTALEDGTIRTAKGDVVQVAKCGVPRFTPTGALM